VPGFRAPSKQTTKGELIHQVDDTIRLPLPFQRYVVSSPQLVVPVEVSGNHHVHRSARVSSYIRDYLA